MAFKVDGLPTGSSRDATVLLRQVWQKERALFPQEPVSLVRCQSLLSDGMSKLSELTCPAQHQEFTSDGASPEVKPTPEDVEPVLSPSVSAAVASSSFFSGRLATSPFSSDGVIRIS